MLYPAATSTDSPLAHMVVHPLQLALVVLFHPPTGANTALALGQLALCGGGLCGIIIYNIYIYIYIRLHLHTWWFHPLQFAPVMFSLTPTGADTKLMLRKLALCGGVFLGGGGRCIRVCGGGGCCYGVLVLHGKMYWC